MDDVQYVFTSLFRWDVFLNAVGKEDDANLVVVLYGTKCQDGGHLCGHFSFGAFCCSEVERATHVDE